VLPWRAQRLRSGQSCPSRFKSPAGIGFQIVHDSFGSNFSFYNHMNVIRSDMGSEQTPSAVKAYLSERIENDSPALPV